MRPAHLLPAAGLTFALALLAPLARGDGQPNARQPPPQLKANAEPKLPPTVNLPITRVVLFNAGVGYFHREGEVTDVGRLDLRFDEADVNDLLKSLVLTDKDGGKVRAVTYDNRMPLDLALKGFTVDVTENPTLGQLMHQVRGEKVEVTDKAGVLTAGQIVSLERPPAPPMGPIPDELLNLLTEDGLQSVELKQLKKIKFVRPELQADFKKALELLATARGDNKKAVSVVFSGNGKRRVAVGYVTEAPLWKPSYRLSVDEKGAARIQGWATVENTTDEDWVNVKVGLVAGRPMTFQMDLYDPLFVPRPVVEPDLFASLRPPMYQGGLNPGGNVGVVMGGNQLGNQFGNQLGANRGFQGGFSGFANQGFQGGFNGNPGNPLDVPSAANRGFGGGFAGAGGGQLGQYGLPGYDAYPPRVPRPNLRTFYGDRLSYADYISRLRGNASTSSGEKPPVQTVKDPLDKQAGALAAGDGALGDMFEYTIDEPITLAKQKSALLPLVNEAVEGSRVSIYNAQTLAKHPLLGLKLTNKTKLHLAQGPVAVYDGGTFAGDARLPDLKPGEMRLVSYAIDLGTEVVVRRDEDKVTRRAVNVTRGYLATEIGLRHTTKYLIRNRNPQDRTVIIEHPRTEGWKLVTPIRPDDQTRSYYRFEITVKAGALATLDVGQESIQRENYYLTGTAPSIIRSVLQWEEAKPAVRDVLTKILELYAKVEAAQQGIADEFAALKEIADDQDRIRKNIEKAPKESDAFKRYLKKFDEQETEIEKRQARIKQLKVELAKQEKAFRDFADNAKAD